MSDSVNEPPLEETVDDLKKIVYFKDTTAPGDVVLIVGRDPQLMVYALVSDIVRDNSKRDEWWQVTMHFLVLPVQKAVWVLRTEQMTGREIFTMEGAERFMQAVDFEDELPAGPGRGGKPDGKKKPQLRIVK